MEEKGKKHFIVFQDLTPKDLRDLATANKVLNRLAELEKLVSVLSFQVDENADKIAFVNSLYGTKVPIDVSLVPKRIKFRNISYSAIMEDLRSAGVFNERNQPVQKYIDEGYFRFVVVKTVVGSTERVMTKTLVYNKGIKLIESIIKKRVGNSERNKVRKGVYRR